MFGFLRKQKNVDAILDPEKGHIAKLGGWIGGMSFTEQERAQLRASTMEAVREYSIKTMGESTQRSTARRSIAILWIKVQLALVLCCVIAIAGGDEARFNMLWTVCGSVLMMGGTGAIITFFFGAYAYGAHIKKQDK